LASPRSLVLLVAAGELNYLVSGMNKVDAGSSEMNDLSGIRRTGTWLRQRKPFTIVMFWAAIAFAFVYISYRWIDPLPPRHLSIASGEADSIYDNFARQYAQILARDGVQLNVRNTAGALENLRLLRDPASGVQAAFGTFGFTEPSDPDALNSLGGIFDGVSAFDPKRTSSNLRHYLFLQLRRCLPLHLRASPTNCDRGAAPPSNSTEIVRAARASSWTFA
jgi:hypothetical protein